MTTLYKFPTNVTSSLTVVISSLSQGQLPPREQAAWLLLPLVFILFLSISRLRRIILDTVETFLATCVLIILVAVVVGLPFGATYIAYRGLGYVASSLFRAYPTLGRAADDFQDWGTEAVRLGRAALQPVGSLLTDWYNVVLRRIKTSSGVDDASYEL